MPNPYSSNSVLHYERHMRSFVFVNASRHKFSSKISTRREQLERIRRVL